MRAFACLQILGSTLGSGVFAFSKVSRSGLSLFEACALVLALSLASFQGLLALNPLWRDERAEDEPTGWPAGLSTARDVLPTSPTTTPQTLKVSLGGRVTRGAVLFGCFLKRSSSSWACASQDSGPASGRRTGACSWRVRPPLRDDQAQSQGMIRFTRPFSGRSSGRSARFALVLPRSGMTI